MLELYWIICGVLFNILVGGAVCVVLWVWIIWPAVEAVSITRMYCAVCKLRGTPRRWVGFIWWTWFRDMAGGRRFECMRSNGWYWGGVGDWNVYHRD